MNLYLFNDNDSAALYGIGAYLNELTHALAGSAIKLHIVNLHSTRPKFEIVKTNKIENWYIPEAGYDNPSLDAIEEIEEYYRNVTFLLRLYITDTKDLIFHFNYNQCYSLAKDLKAAFNCKTVAVVHYTKWSLELQGNLHGLRMIKTKPEIQRSSFEQMMYIAHEYEIALFNEVDRVIVLSGFMKRILETDCQIDSQKISVIPGGLKDKNPQQKIDRDEWRKKWHISGKESVILFVGRLQPVKGLTFLISAFRKVLEKIPDGRLIIAGSGNYENCFREAKDICTKISFTGLLEKEDLQELYQIADVGVVPSLFETFGYVAVEMMMHELPIVSTATTGLNEVVDDACGIKIPVIQHQEIAKIDVSSLSEKIIYLLQHPNEAKLLGKNARIRYLNHYSTDIFRKNMLEFYQSLLIS